MKHFRAVAGLKDRRVAAGAGAYYTIQHTQRFSMAIEVTVMSLDLDLAETPQRQIFDQAEITVGRVPENDIVLDSPLVSKFHLKLYTGENGKLYVMDLGSTNGTALEQFALPAGMGAEVIPNQRILLGNFLIRALIVKTAEKPRIVEERLPETPHVEPETIFTPEPVVAACQEVAAPVPQKQMFEFNFDATQLFSLKGVVSHHNQPLKDVLIAAGVLGELKTAEDGSYLFENIAEGTSFQLNASLPGFRFDSAGISGRLDSDCEINFNPKKLIAIRCKARHHEAPLAGVSIVAGNLGSFVTDEQGCCAIADVEEGAAFEISARCDGYAIEANGAAQGTAGITDSEIEFVAKKLSPITGTVLHKELPLSGVTISAGELGSAMTDEKGNYCLPAIAEGANFEVKASIDGYQLSSSAALTGTMETEALAIEFSAQKLFTVSGMVSRNGKPLAGVTIDGGELGLAVTDETGRYTFENVPEDSRCSFTASKEGFEIRASVSPQTAPAAEQVRTTEIVLDNSLDLSQAPLHELSKEEPKAAPQRSRWSRLFSGNKEQSSDSNQIV